MPKGRAVPPSSKVPLPLNVPKALQSVHGCASLLVEGKQYLISLAVDECI